MFKTKVFIYKIVLYTCFFFFKHTFLDKAKASF